MVQGFSLFCNPPMRVSGGEVKQPWMERDVNMSEEPILAICRHESSVEDGCKRGTFLCVNNDSFFLDFCLFLILKLP